MRDAPDARRAYFFAHQTHLVSWRIALKCRQGPAAATLHLCRCCHTEAVLTCDAFMSPGKSH